MIVILSPAKRLDYETPLNTDKATRPLFLEDANAIANELKTYSVEQVAGLMSISDKLAELNVRRFDEFNHAAERPALMAFDGDTYKNIDWQTYTTDDYDFAQKHIRILSGLYGILRPLDLIKPYRFEMGITGAVTVDGCTVRTLWSSKVLRQLIDDLDESGNNVLVNLASTEYSSIFTREKLSTTIVTPVFRDWNHRSGKFAVVGIYAKLARGAMADYIVRNRINDYKQLIEFDGLGYEFVEQKKPVKKKFGYTCIDFVFQRRQVNE